MTENEAISKLDSLRYRIRRDPFCNKVYNAELEALVEARMALEEIQQYRAIGTVEECRAAVEKQKAKKRNVESYCGFDTFECPVCGACVDYKNEYCHRCGQAIA